MAYQIQINLRLMGGNPSRNDLDLLAFGLANKVQEQLPCKIFGYGVIEIEAPEMSRPVSLTGEPAMAEIMIETAAPIRMMEDALL